jgi:hypothetical protein
MRDDGVTQAVRLVVVARSMCVILVAVVLVSASGSPQPEVEATVRRDPNITREDAKDAGGGGPGSRKGAIVRGSGNGGLPPNSVTRPREPGGGI